MEIYEISKGHWPRFSISELTIVIDTAYKKIQHRFINFEKILNNKCFINNLKISNFSYPNPSIHIPVEGQGRVT